jgi:hypothetical protein
MIQHWPAHQHICAQLQQRDLDFVKLALLMGDKYVLDLFGRASNTYAKSALDMVKSNVRNNPESAQQLLDKMKGNLDSLATKAIHSGRDQQVHKYQHQGRTH